MSAPLPTNSVPTSSTARKAALRIIASNGIVSADDCRALGLTPEQVLEDASRLWEVALERAIEVLDAAIEGKDNAQS